MERKTSDSYQKEVLEQYKLNKGGELSTYLLNPTPRLIKQACILLLNKRTSPDDRNTLNCFFQFKEDENRLREVKGFENDRFKPIVNFLKGRTKNTSEENIELISWLIDFNPRPLRQYLKSYNPISELDHTKPESFDELKNSDISKPNKSQFERNLIKRKLDKTKNNEEKKKKRSRILTISIIVTFGMTILILGRQKWNSNRQNRIIKETECMTWSDSLYVAISCNEYPLSKHGTQVKPLDPMELKNMRKVEVNASYQFFNEEGKPMIWYYKNKEGEIEYFTAPGLHPRNGETLRKITPYIIETYVPNHMDRKNSFVP
ncbi:hypothetical protein ACNR9Q_05605 [Maribacter sp. X9]|uniref:hypothetical protein n=1 Tax=Maribacter sp. X9 TaxID=3402159 RepID=UPI003AF3337F